MGLFCSVLCLSERADFVSVLVRCFAMEMMLVRDVDPIVAMSSASNESGVLVSPMACAPMEMSILSCFLSCEWSEVLSVPFSVSI